ncbi:general transcription factor IIH subunit 2-like [Octopus vulgaris]|uniref:General transcription factor IIH subunit n=2 Tax=Octopus TaxID=6643 RepID=A0AA36EZH6_OCTVU|nr:general transcription factor IIH subunit 2-like [Octopus vulgaris]
MSGEGRSGEKLHNMADDDENLYRWETAYERTWEAIKEDEAGSLQASVAEITQKTKRRRLLERISNVRLGMMRHLFLIIDMSEAMVDPDLKPNRLAATVKLAENFIEEYFDQNPISQLGIIVTRKKRAEKVTELGGNPRRHVAALVAVSKNPCQGEPSLQNSIEMAAQTLKQMPSHASREILIIFGSLTTCDPGDILNTIKTVKESSIRCSVIGLSAEVRVCRKLTAETKGDYRIILDESHFKDLLNGHVIPPPASGNTESSLIRMGFPHHQQSMDKDKEDRPSMCMCHLDDKASQNFSSGGYFCPQCRSKYCELPVECKACALTLVSAPHLARSYHHLFPLANFKEVVATEAVSDKPQFCYGCQISLKEKNIYICTKCDQNFCIDCDLFAHETLHCCPGCSSSRSTQQIGLMESFT